MSPVRDSSWEICRLFSSCRRHLDQEARSEPKFTRKSRTSRRLFDFENELPAYIINCQLQQFNCTSFSDQQGIELKKCDDKYEDAIERLLSANDPWRRIFSAGRGGTSTQSRHHPVTSVQTPWVQASAGQKTRRQENDRKILHVMAAMLVTQTTQNFAEFV